MGRRKIVGGIRVSSGRGFLLGRQSEGHLRSLLDDGAGEDLDKGAPLGPAGVGEIVAIPAGRDPGAGRRPSGAGAEGGMIFDGALEGAVNASRNGRTDGA